MTDLLGTALEYVEAGGSMQDAGFYDRAMTGPDEPAMLPLDRSPWKPIYDEAARWIPSSTPVVDLGCGTGRFIARLFRTSHTAHITGVDFSAAALSEAHSYLSGEASDEWVNDPIDEVQLYRRLTLKQCDLREWKPEAGASRTAFVCLEVLEHLDDDLGLIRRIPPMTQFVFSVPNYLSASHVRCFPTLASVFERYGHLVQIRRWSLVDFGGGNVVHVCDSIRRPDSW